MRPIAKVTASFVLFTVAACQVCFIVSRQLSDAFEFVKAVTSWPQ